MAKVSKAASLIKGLINKGYTKAAIAKAVGRDSSLISQIEKGKKPGSNLVESLEKFKKTGKAAEAPRRQTKSGTSVKVRQKTLKNKKGEPIATPKVKGLDKTYINMLKKFKHNVAVKMVYKKWKAYKSARASKQTVSVFGKGIDPKTIIKNAKEDDKTISEYLHDMAVSIHNPDKAEGLEGIYFVGVGEDDE